MTYSDQLAQTFPGTPAGFIFDTYEIFDLDDQRPQHYGYRIRGPKTSWLLMRSDEPRILFAFAIGGPTRIRGNTWFYERPNGELAVY